MGSTTTTWLTAEEFEAAEARRERAEAADFELSEALGAEMLAEFEA